MSNICINCSTVISDQKEFCDKCEAKLDQMVDATYSSPKALVDTNVNVLFQTRNITGKVIDSDSDSITTKIFDDEEGSYVFWRNLLFLVFFMILIIVFTISSR